MTVCIYCSSVCSAFHDFRALAHVSFPVAGMLSFSECKKRKKHMYINIRIIHSKKIAKNHKKTNIQKRLISLSKENIDVEI